MRKANREIKSPLEIEEVLRAARVMRLALCQGEQPYVVPLNFGYADGALYFHCAHEGRKLDIIRVNPRVAFEVEAEVEIISGETPCRWTTHYRSVVGSGRAHILSADDERKRGLDVIMAHHGVYSGEYGEKDFSLATVVRIEVESMTGKKYGFD